MSLPSFEKTPLNKVKRLPKRGHYDRETINSILDAHFLCHIAWEKDGRPQRKDDTLYIHVSSKSRMLEDPADGRPLCLVVTHIPAALIFEEPIPDAAMKEPLSIADSIYTRFKKHKPT